MHTDNPFDLKQLTHRKIGPVDVFSVFLPKFYGQVSAFNQVLSPKEHAKAQRFITEELSQRYIIAHGVLRCLLADTLGIDARAVNFLKSERGKPYLEDNELYFNMSHSEDMALFGLSRDVQVGVDIEYCLRKQVSILDIAKRFFNVNEYEKLSQLSGDALITAFYHGWTRKEAILKGMGYGIADHLATCEVSILPDEPTALLAFHNDEAQTNRWHLENWYPRPEYIAAIAYSWP